jgi:hypothetical protein
MKNDFAINRLPIFSPLVGFAEEPFFVVLFEEFVDPHVATLLGFKKYKRNLPELKLINSSLAP